MATIDELAAGYVQATRDYQKSRSNEAVLKAQRCHGQLWEQLRSESKTVSETYQKLDARIARAKGQVGK